jgi:very-long-chain enoyl-CoA reductase
MIMLHFLKREYETIFVHKFSLATMPWGNIWWNCGWYWLGAGLVLAPEIYSDFSSTASESANLTKLNYLGIVIYLYGEISNFITHLNLASLRSRGGTERKIPHGYGFNIVTCPNYMFELVSWIGVLLVTRTAGAVLFFGLALWKMNQWGMKKERAYRIEFPDTYKRKDHYVVPSPGAVISAIVGGSKK